MRVEEVVFVDDQYEVHLEVMYGDQVKQIVLVKDDTFAIMVVDEVASISMN